MDTEIAEILSNHATATVKSSGGGKPSTLPRWIKTVVKQAPVAALTVVMGAVTLTVTSAIDPDMSARAESVSPAGPEYLKPEFFETAIRTMQHNAGISREEAAAALDFMEDMGQNCKTAANNSGEFCAFSDHGVYLNFEKEDYRAIAQPIARDGSVVLGRQLTTARQKGDVLELTDNQLFWNNIKGP